MSGVPVAPPGLDYLVEISGLYMNRTGENCFDFFSPVGRLVYQASELRDCCGPRMDLRVYNTQGYNVLYMLLHNDLCSWENKLQVSSSSGELLGCIDKKSTNLPLRFDIMDPAGLIYLKVKGPGMRDALKSEVNYKVLSADTTAQVGVITRVHKETFSSKNNYTLTFPMDLHVNVKAILIACAMYIDILNEEKKKRPMTVGAQGGSA